MHLQQHASTKQYSYQVCAFANFRVARHYKMHMGGRMRSLAQIRLKATEAAQPSLWLVYSEMSTYRAHLIYSSRIQVKHK